MSARVQAGPGRCYAVVAVVLVVGGCASHPHQTAEQEWTQEAPELARSIELPKRCAQLSIRRFSMPGAPGGAPGGDERLRADRRALFVALHDLLEGSRCFERVAYFRPSSPPRSGIVLDVDLERAALWRDAESDSFGTALCGWLALGWLYNWWHDHTYVLDLEAVFTLRDAASGRELARIGPARGSGRAQLSFVERRPDAGAFAATVFYWPQLALDSSPEEVTRWLAPLALRAPARQLLGELGGLLVRYRVQMRESPKLPEGLKLEVLSPAPGGLLERPRADVEVRVSVNPALGRLKAISFCGETQPASGAAATVEFPAMWLEPGRDNPIVVTLTKGRPIVAGGLRVLEGLVHERELAPPATGAAAPEPK